MLTGQAYDSMTTCTAVIVEDSPAFATRIADVVRTLGAQWQPVILGTGAEAIAAIAAAREPIALVLVDLGLPDMPGHEVIARARLALPSTPVMVVSVLSSEDSVLQAIQSGARGYLQKDDSTLNLAQAIAGVIAGEYPISPSLAHHLFRLAGATPPALRPGTEPLSARELELLHLLGLGYTREEAARRMQVSGNTVQTYCKRIYLKLDVASKGEALHAARARGILPG